jgi:hypothetical protein
MKRRYKKNGKEKERKEKRKGRKKEIDPADKN